MLYPSKRLITAAGLLDCGGKTVDIGTDHAYLPAYLVLTKKASRALACDIGEKPLENAARTLKAYGLEDKIELRVSDGLKNVSPDEADEISVCGMGGTLIAEILEIAPWIKRRGLHLVLQPMTHSEDVRRYLCLNGFGIEKELCVSDSGRTYVFISARYSGENIPKEPGYYYFGELLNEAGDAETYINKQISRVVTRADALKEARRFPDEEKLLRSVIDYYERNKKRK